MLNAKYPEYNGWSSWATWNCKLWLDNEESDARYWQFKAEQHAKRYGKENPHLLADELKEHHEQQMPELSGIFADLLNAAFSEINWQEIAESFLNDAVEEMESAK
jgi:hypothetical protein